MNEHLRLQIAGMRTQLRQSQAYWDEVLATTTSSVVGDLAIRRLNHLLYLESMLPYIGDSVDPDEIGRSASE